MHANTFANSPSGRLVPTERGCNAFVQNDLPPDLDLGPIAHLIASASQALGELSGIGRVIPNPYVLIRPLQTREALTSSSMEGTYSTADEVLLLDAGDTNTNGGDTREVLNYRRALEGAIASFERLPLCLRTLRDAHRTLLSGLTPRRGGRIEPGEFKRHQNFIGALEIEKARFIPPPPADAVDAMVALERYWHREGAGSFLPHIVDSALIHYQFETIHPFADGNGRVGRMLITLHLMHCGLINQPILYLSPTLEGRKDEYIDRMFEVSRSGDWLGWLRFFLTAMEDAARQTIATADQLLRLQVTYRERLRKPGISAKAFAAIDFCLERPVFSIPQLAKHLSTTYPTAKTIVETLIEAGILNEIQNVSPRFFRAGAILDIVAGKR
jgi:Fic family protein